MFLAKIDKTNTFFNRNVTTKFVQLHYFLSQNIGADERYCVPPRGVTRFDGARGKKQVWCPDVRTRGLSEANLLYWRKCLWHCWDLSAAPQSFIAFLV